MTPRARSGVAIVLAAALAGCGGGAAAGGGAKAPAKGARSAGCPDVARELALLSERAHHWSKMKEGGTVRIAYEYDRMAAALTAGATRLGALEPSEPDLAQRVSASKASLTKLSTSVVAFGKAMDGFLLDAGRRWQRAQASISAARAACQKAKADCRALASVDERAGGLDSTDEVKEVHDALAKLPAKPAELARARDEATREVDGLGGAIAKFQDLDPIDKAALDDMGKSLAALRGKCEDALPRPALVPSERWVTGGATEPRRVAAVVRVPLQGKLRDQFMSFAEAEEDEGRAALFRAVSDGGFGSGVALVHELGGERRSFVVTNEHVVKSSTNAIVYFDKSGPLSADVVYVDAERDLAILALRKELSAGVALAASPPKDQDVVFAAGFPGFGAMPSYQITRGYVSNERLSLGPGMQHVQHTAPIDPGSSGGPLLSESKELVGLNTKKGIGRENVGIAVPAMYVAEAVRAAREAPALLGDPDGRRRAARRSCLEFLNQLGGDGAVTLLEHRVAVGLVEAKGLESYNMLLEAIPQLDAVLKNDPLQAFRLAVARRIADDLRQAKISPYEACLDPVGADYKDIVSTDRVRFTLATRGGPRTLTVRLEQGTYKVSGFDFAERPAGKKR